MLSSVRHAILREKGSSSFLKKRTKKLLFVRVRIAPGGAELREQKFFVSFFQKRNASFLLTDCPATNQPGRRYPAVLSTTRHWRIELLSGTYWPPFARRPAGTVRPQVQ
jgi:hypothetical protein